LITVKIFQIYHIESKGNYKDENINNEKLKLEIKNEKKNLNVCNIISKK
jgi:hypothetical protein